MSIDTRLSSVAVNAQAQTTAKLLDGGFFELMDGERPDSPDDRVSADFRLVRCALSPVAFAIPTDGWLRANAIAKGIATKTGDPTWCRCVTRDGVPIIDGTVGKSNANAISTVETIVAGQSVIVTEFTHKVSARGD